MERHQPLLLTTLWIGSGDTGRLDRHDVVGNL
jgi:hypothetical protein